MSRFDYVRYDDIAAKKQATLKAHAQDVEKAIEDLERARHKMAVQIENLDQHEACSAFATHRAMEHLNDATGPDIEQALADIEEAYMWCGKAIRDDQIARNGTAELQENRGAGDAD